MGPSSRHLDDRDRRLDALGHLPGKTQLRSYHFVYCLQINPALRVHLILPANGVRKPHSLLWLLQSHEGRKALNIRNLGIRAHHIRLPRKNKDPQGLIVISEDIPNKNRE